MDRTRNELHRFIQVPSALVYTRGRRSTILYQCILVQVFSSAPRGSDQDTPESVIIDRRRQTRAYYGIFVGRDIVHLLAYSLMHRTGLAPSRPSLKLSAVCLGSIKIGAWLDISIAGDYEVICQFRYTLIVRSNSGPESVGVRVSVAVTKAVGLLCVPLRCHSTSHRLHLQRQPHQLHPSPPPDRQTDSLPILLSPCCLSEFTLCAAATLYPSSCHPCSLYSLFLS